MRSSNRDEGIKIVKESPFKNLEKSHKVWTEAEVGAQQIPTYADGNIVTIFKSFFRLHILPIKIHLKFAIGFLSIFWMFFTNKYLSSLIDKLITKTTDWILP